MSNILIDEELKQAIKDQVDMVHLIGQYVTLIEESTVFKGLCPFHEEKTPSLAVKKDDSGRGSSFYCYGCHAGNYEETGIGSDAIGFVMAKEDVDFVQACKMLCDMYNIPYKTRHTDPEVIKMKQEMTTKNVEYYNNLARDSKVLRYLRDRGVNNESIASFRLGLTSGNEYPAWKSNRLVFGITDTNYDSSKAQTIAMGFRLLQGQVESEDGLEYYPNIDLDSKYRNSANSKIFTKSSTLYGLNLAAKSIKRSGYALVVEGYLDVILMHQAGFTNTVASMGTSFSETQMDLIKSYTDQLLFFMDTDEAGLLSMRQILPKLLEKGFNVLVVEAPKGKDPADLVRVLGQDNSMVSDYIKSNSHPALQWCTKGSIELYESAVHRAKVAALEAILPILDKVNHRSSKIAYISDIANKLGIDASLLVDFKPDKQPMLSLPNRGEVNNIPVISAAMRKVS